MKFYIIFSGYDDDPVQNYTMDAYVSEASMMKAFKENLNQKFLEDDVDGRSLDECMRDLSYSDGYWQMFVESFEVPKEEVAA